MRNLAVLTSGGDAPGMNVAICAAVRTCLSHGFTVWGVYQRFSGLIERDSKRLGVEAVEQTAAGNGGLVIGIKDIKIRSTPLEEIVQEQQPLDARMLKMVDMLAR